MEANMKYNIKENTNPQPAVDIESLMAEVNEKHKISEKQDLNIIPDSLLAWELDYDTNYTVKQLGQISDYYGINKNRLKKDELIQVIILFEEDMNNIYIVETRKRLWENIKELKKDKYFSKFIMFNA
tara:strand:- start:27514 stop:27894 length:381 start_codon:yes stop_codon:yes gene_type:complete